MLPIYEAANIDVAWGVGAVALDLTEGLADGTFLEVAAINDMLEETFGASGEMSISKLAGKGGTITLTVKQTAPVNLKLAKIASAQMKKGAPVIPAPFLVEDKTSGSAHFIALNAVLKSQPTHSFDASMGEKSWVWVCESFIPTDDPVTTLAEITAYISL